MTAILSMSMEDLRLAICDADPRLFRILRTRMNLTSLRNRVFEHLNKLERQYFNLYSPKQLTRKHIIERDNAKECIRVLKNIIRTENEKITGFSALSALQRLAGDISAADGISPGFLCEILFLLRGVNADAHLSANCFNRLPARTDLDAHERSGRLDRYAESLELRMRRYRNGLDPDISGKRLANVRRIRKYFHASDSDWSDFRWQLAHVVSSREVLKDLVNLNEQEQEGLALAEEHRIPFQITPYYLSIFNMDRDCDYDRGPRVQVLPSPDYCRLMAHARKQSLDQDYMGERLCSPTPCVTRRYPQIAIFKPFDSCPQICVYCQRNWEITSLEHARFHADDIHGALKWMAVHPSIREVLITGGDPLTLPTHKLAWILGRLSKLENVERIRIGTRIPVTLPFRIDKHLLELLNKYHIWGRREIAVVTHVEYPAEITEDFLNAVTAIKKLGMNIYNQQVFTYFNSRRYETCYLRRILKRCGVDPYYLFNTKGKHETRDFRVPMARMEQERHEEARLMPGLVRTDEPVFNVPMQGKSSLVAWQDHEPVMILPNGGRVYRFYPWESRIAFADDYLYEDVPIYDYLKRLEADGEDADDYLSIWYYF
jgi:lysine 2,3-aminomutase